MAGPPKPAATPAASPIADQTSSGIGVKPVYTPEDLKALRNPEARRNVQQHDEESEVGYPGRLPFTRGIQPTMYRGRLWTMRQYAGMGDAEESNKRYKFLLAQGTKGLS